MVDVYAQYQAQPSGNKADGLETKKMLYLPRVWRILTFMGKVPAA